jgi:hypothetical protein
VSVDKLKNICLVKFHDPFRSGEAWDDVVVLKRHEAFAAACLDIAALEEKHAAEIAELTETADRLSNMLWNRDTEIEQLKSKMSGMVCGTCFGRGLLETPNTLRPCPVCQPKKEG